MPTPLQDLITTRSSTRAFLKDKPVLRETIDEALSSARYSASNLNTQPWRLLFVSGAARDRVAVRMQAAWDGKVNPQIEPLPDAYKIYQSAWGEGFFGKTLGYARDDDAARHAWFKHNFNFFGAPTAAIVMMDEGFHHEDSLGVGLFLDAFGLVLRERGVESCLMVSVAGYADLLRDELGIEPHMKVLCAVALGYPDQEHKANHFKPEKEPVKKFATFRDD